MKNALKSIKLIIKVAPYDFIMIIFSLAIKLLGPIIYTFSVLKLFKEVENILLVGHVNVKTVVLFSVALFISRFHNIFYMRFYSTFVSMPRIESRLKEIIHKKIDRISSVDLINPVSDTKINQAIFAGTNIFRLMQTSLELITTIISSLSLVAIILNIDIYLSIAIIIALIPIVASQIYESNIKIENRDNRIEISRLKKINQSAISGNPQFIESRMNFADDFFQDKFSHFSDEYLDLIKGETNSIYKFNLKLILLHVYSNSVGLVAPSIMLYLNRISFSEFGGVYSACDNIKMQCENIISLLNYGRQFSYMVRPYFDFINMKEREGDKIHNNGTIKLQDVSFKYKNTTKNAVSEINLEIKPKEKIAIVGINGSGKTTLARLSIGELLPTTGFVYHDGISTNEIGEKYLYNSTSQVSQFFSRYALSLKENISFNNEINFSQEDTNKFLKRDDISLDSMMLKEFGGHEMSGGEWQRVAILRGFNKSSDLITLDEPTSAIDPLNEKEIYDFFEEHSKNKTEIMVTHRMGAIKYVDRIIVLDRGNIVEDGNFDELIKRDGMFAKIYKSQSESFVRE